MRYGVGFPKKRRPLGKPADRLTWGRCYVRDWDEERWRSREHAMERCMDNPPEGEAPTYRSQARKGAHDRGRITEEPCEGKLSRTVLKQRRGK